jgi:hypothetical protein
MARIGRRPRGLRQDYPDFLAHRLIEIKEAELALPIDGSERNFLMKALIAADVMISAVPDMNVSCREMDDIVAYLDSLVPPKND